MPPSSFAYTPPEEEQPQRFYSVELVVVVVQPGWYSHSEGSSRRGKVSPWDFGGYHKSSNNYNKIFNNSIVRFVNVVIIALSIYALTVTHVANSACGPGLWNLLLARLVMSIGYTLVVVSVLCAGSSDNDDDAPAVLNAFRMTIGLFLSFVYILTFIVLEAVFATQAMQSSSCMTALDNNNNIVGSSSSGNGRMLPIMVYVYMSMDCLTLLLLLLCVSYAAYNHGSLLSLASVGL